MHAIVDTHLHLYPNYDIEAAFKHFIKNTPIAVGQIRVACLAERHDCQYFEDIRSQTITLKSFKLVDADTASQANELLIESTADGERFTLLPGRQVISAENIEVLALACPQTIGDGLPASEIIIKVNSLGGLPVVAWSPGKWFFSRGKVVTSLLNTFANQDFVIGDTSLRPYFWPLPFLMRKARNKGFAIIAGSDPLPFSGEESWYGGYTSELKGNANTATELLIGLKNGSTTCLVNAGKRSWPLDLLKRLKANAASK